MEWMEWTAGMDGGWRAGSCGRVRAFDALIPTAQNPESLDYTSS